MVAPRGLPEVLSTATILYSLLGRCDQLVLFYILGQSPSAGLGVSLYIKITKAFERVRFDLIPLDSADNGDKWIIHFLNNATG
jgi:hypothetical protein